MTGKKLIEALIALILLIAVIYAIFELVTKVRYGWVIVVVIILCIMGAIWLAGNSVKSLLNGSYK